MTASKYEASIWSEGNVHGLDSGKDTELCEYTKTTELYTLLKR